MLRLLFIDALAAVAPEHVQASQLLLLLHLLLQTKAPTPKEKKRVSFIVHCHDLKTNYLPPIQQIYSGTNRPEISSSISCLTFSQG